MGQGKLVRDKVPARIATTTGQQPVTEVVDPRTFRWDAAQRLCAVAEQINRAVHLRIAQESDGAKKAHHRHGQDIEYALADGLEILEVIAAAEGISWLEVLATKVTRHTEEGGYDKRIRLVG